MGRLRWLLAGFFLALAVPSAVLVQQAFSQLQWEAFHRHRQLAEELHARVDKQLSTAMTAEEGRRFADYRFLVVEGEVGAGFVQRSPLAAFPVSSPVPGLLAYFQVDADGSFSTPLLPEPDAPLDALGIPPGEYAERLALGRRVHELLSAQRLARRRVDELKEAVAPSASEERAAELASQAPDLEDESDAMEELMDIAPAAEPPATPALDTQAAFERLNVPEEAPSRKREAAAQALGRLSDLKLDSSYAEKAQPADEAARPRSAATPRAKRLEQGTVLLLAQAPAEAEAEAQDRAQAVGFREVPVTTFDAEVAPFSFAVLDADHFVLFRNVWREGKRFVQGAIVARAPFIEGLLEAAFRDTALSRASDLVLGYRGDVLRVFSAREADRYPPASSELEGSLLYRAPLSAPFSELELISTVTELPFGPGAAVVGWTALLLLAMLCGGFLLLYRLGVRQLALQTQQQDFVSAVSHELKTPLTSIRMYGEMLRAGWVEEGRRQTYYDFIFHESERLSRLIANVLQLARMTRNELVLELKPVTVGALLDVIRSKVSSQVEHAGFELDVAQEGDPQARVRVDQDAISQVFINLVDNALKFSAGAERKRVELRAYRQADRAVVLAVRDHGPGVARDQLKRIFELFYRPAGELTRETVGTGIGLALVHQLVTAMGGTVDAVNRDPGAEFRVALPIAPS